MWLKIHWVLESVWQLCKPELRSGDVSSAPAPPHIPALRRLAAGCAGVKQAGRRQPIVGKWLSSRVSSRATCRGLREYIKCSGSQCLHFQGDFLSQLTMPTGQPHHCFCLFLLAMLFTLTWYLLRGKRNGQSSGQWCGTLTGDRVRPAHGISSSLTSQHLAPSPLFWLLSRTLGL